MWKSGDWVGACVPRIVWQHVAWEALKRGLWFVVLVLLATGQIDASLATPLSGRRRGRVPESRQGQASDPSPLRPSDFLFASP